MEQPAASICFANWRATASGAVNNFGEWCSGNTSASGAEDRRSESYLPSHIKVMTKLEIIFKSKKLGSVSIYGANTLDRYTRNILYEGFEEINKSIKLKKPLSGIIFQIHGYKEALKDDRAILKILNQELTHLSGKNILILLHRPDEIQDRLPELNKILYNAKQPFGLVFLGDKHINDKFYDIPRIIKEIIPHGFFDFSVTPIEQTQIIIGSHTTWGDMRSTEHVLKLLGEIFQQKNNCDKAIYGYLGGKPADELNLVSLQKNFGKLFPKIKIKFIAVDQKLDISKFNHNENIIFVENQNIQPHNLQITFNIQLYYYGNYIRTGESSGSVHSGVSIPVILEMNNSDKIEDLKVIKVPYNHKTKNIKSIDLHHAAEEILLSINSGRYINDLNHNFIQAKHFNNRSIAMRYLKLFEKIRNESKIRSR